eukprot:EC826289.1.p1 GENE.EC826289.1~~EC826289.1.p1  ORF type:complete len:137 (+),score=65.65 EC826289.1:48-458(+)
MVVKEEKKIENEEDYFEKIIDRDLDEYFPFNFLPVPQVFTGLEVLEQQYNQKQEEMKMQETSETLKIDTLKLQISKSPMTPTPLTPLTPIDEKITPNNLTIQTNNHSNTKIFSPMVKPKDKWLQEILLDHPFRNEN